MCASFFCLSEIDRISGKNTVKEAQELRKGYQGSIRYADCAQQSDAAKIRQEIDEHIDEAKGFCGDCCVAWWMSYEMNGDAEQFASRTSGPVIKGAALMAKLLNLMEFPLRNRCCFDLPPQKETDLKNIGPCSVASVPGIVSTLLLTHWWHANCGTAVYLL